MLDVLNCFSLGVKFESTYEGKILDNRSLIMVGEGKPCGFRRDGLNRYSALSEAIYGINLIIILVLLL